MQTWLAKVCLAALAVGALVVPAGAQHAQGGTDWATVTPAPRQPGGQSAPAAPAPAPAASASVASAGPFKPLDGAADVSTVTAEKMGQSVTVTASVIESVASGNERAPSKLLVRQDPKLWVIYYGQIAPIVEGGKGAPKAGTKISAKGVVGEFKGELQIKVSAPEDLVIEGVARGKGGLAGVGEAEAKAIAEAAKLPGVTSAKGVADKIEQPVVLVGVVQNYRAAWSETAPNVITFADESGVVEGVYWSDLGAKIDASLLKPGTAVVLHGIGNKYKDKIQVKLDGEKPLQKLDPAKVAEQIK